MKKLLITLLVVGVAFLSPKIAKATDYPPRELTVKFRSDATRTQRQNVYQKVGSPRSKIDRLGVEILDVAGDPKQIAKIVNRLPGVEYAEPDYLATVLEVTNDPYLFPQWGIFKIQAAATASSGWNFTHGSLLNKIAIVDTGIDESHPDLGSKVTDRTNCSDSPTNQDKYGHGTHVAGIAAGDTNNGIGVAGVGYNSTLLNAKALNDSGSGAYSWIASCIVWSADNGAKVINMSLGGQAKSFTLENAVNYAWDKGVIIVAAAGNNGTSAKFYPAAYQNVISVAATDQNDRKASWSTYGKWVSVAAPGVDIYSTFPTYSYVIGKSLNYDYGSGTSMASPHVAGLAALMAGSSQQIRDRIQTTSDKISGTGSYWKYGRINVLRAAGP